MKVITLILVWTINFKLTCKTYFWKKNLKKSFEPLMEGQNENYASDVVPAICILRVTTPSFHRKTKSKWVKKKKKLIEADSSNKLKGVEVGKSLNLLIHYNPFNVTHS